MSDIVLIARAWNFAAERHCGQRRKGEAQEPYVNHLAEVAELVAVATEGRDAPLVAAAVLHDTVEDTATTGADIERLFGADVADLVAEVTDDKSLPKAERKAQQVHHAPHRSDRAKVLKLADKTSNLRALASSPPAGWSAARRAEYIDWAERVVAGLRGTNPWLEARFDEAATRARDAVDGAAGDRAQAGLGGA